MFLRLISLSAVFISSISAWSSDHIDGPVTQKHRVADLSDFYVFTHPSQPNISTLILNTYPLVPTNGHFDSKLKVRFHIKRLHPSTLLPVEGPENYLKIECSFVTPKEHNSRTPHQSRCQSNHGLSASSIFNQISQTTGPLKYFHGMRSDPFFFNSGWSKDAMEGKLSKPASSNTMDSLNILTLVLELDLRTFFKEHSLFGIAAEVLTQNTPEAQLTRLDRVGRPEITNVSLFTPKGDFELRDLYNLEDSFEISEKNRTQYVARLNKNIQSYDALDKVTHWNPTQLTNLTQLLSHDYLIYDNSKACTKNSFLEIESSYLGGSAHQSCGGRSPEQDIMDSLYTLYISGLNGKKIQDGINAPSRALLATFPYLAEADLSVTARMKAALGRKLLGL